MNKLTTIYLLLILSSACSFAPRKTESFKDFLRNNNLKERKTFLYSGCSIFDVNGDLVRGYTGDNCLFEDDGSYLISEDNGDLNYKNKFNLIIWSLRGIYSHHGLRRDNNGDYLVIASEVQKVSDKDVRFDLLYKVSRSKGEILAQYSFFKNYENIAGHHPYPSDFSKQTWFNKLKVSLELTHVNAFYQVNVLQSDSKQTIQQNDFIVYNQSQYTKRILILDEKTFSLKQQIIPTPIMIHDVQALDGSLIYFNNVPNGETMADEEVIATMKKTTGESLIEIMNLKDGATHPYFDSSTPSPFLMHYAGSLQTFPDGSVLTTDMSNKKIKFVFINKEQKVLKTMDVTQNFPIGINFVKLENLYFFLRNNIGL